MLKRILTKHWSIAFVALILSALVFGLSSFNLFYLVKANLTFIAEYGALALMEGAAQQFLELLLMGTVSAAAYVLIKACEKILVDRLLK